MSEKGEVRIIKVRVETDISDHRTQMIKMRKQTEQGVRGASESVRKWNKVARKGMMATRLMGREVGLLSTVLSGAGTAAGPAGIAVAGVGAAAVGSIYGVAKFGQAMVNTADQARELVAVAKEHPEFIDQSQVDRLIATDDALGAVRLAVQGAGVALAVEFAPMIEKAATYAVAGALAIKDYGSDIYDLGVKAVETGKKMYDIIQVVQTLGDLGPFKLINMGARAAVVEVGRASDEFEEGKGQVQSYTERAESLISTFDDIKTSAGGAVDKVKEFNDIWTAGNDIAAITADAESDLVDRQTAIFLEYEKRIQAVQEMGGNEEQVAEAVRALQARRQREMKKAREEEAAEREKKLQEDLAAIDLLKEAQEKADKAIADAAEAAAEAQKARTQQNIDTMFAFGNAALEVAGQTRANIEELKKGSGRDLKKIARRQRGFAIASALMSGAQAAVGGFMPPPVGFGAIGGFAFLPLIAAQVATQIAVIKKGASEVRHAGGPINRAAGAGGGTLAPDEVQVTGKDGEFMVNGMGRAAAGDKALNALNRGERSAGAAPAFALQLDHRYFSEFIARDRRLVGSELGAALNKNKGIGYRNG